MSKLYEQPKSDFMDEIFSLRKQLTAMRERAEKLEADRDIAETAWRVEKERAEAAEQRIEVLEHHLQELEG